jgi:uncharacterized membrane protein
MVPRTENRTLIWAIVVASSAIVVLSAIIGPRPAFAGLCHQLPERSFLIGDHLFAVCHRCFGLYLGILTGLVMAAVPAIRYRFDRLGLGLVLLSAAILASEALIGFAELTPLPSLARSATGLMLGFAVGIWFAKLIGFRTTSFSTQPVNR